MRKIVFYFALSVIEVCILTFGKVAALLILFFTAVLSAAAGNSTTPGTLQLVPSFENIAVYANFTGDDNGNNDAVLEYREVGATAWKPGIAMTVDRRNDLVLYGSGTIANPYKNQWRAVIFWLTPDTNYEVRVTYTDADGVVGANPVTATATTRNDNPPSTGNTYYVATTGNDVSGNGSLANPWKTIGKAASVVSAGDIVRIIAGTYSGQVILTTSGTAGNYIIFRSHDPNNKAIVTAAVRGTFRLNGASYIRLKELDLRSTSSDGSCVFIEGNCDGNIVEDCSTNSIGTNWWAGGIIIEGTGYSPGPTNTLIQRNNISTTADGSDGPFGVLLDETGGSTVIRYDTIIGGFYDGIGGAPNFGVNGGPYQNSYIYGNIIEGTNDDGIEAEGAGMNVGIWGNTIKNSETMGFGIAPVIVGPMYLFRNVITDCGEAAFKLGSSSYGFIYAYHNTIYSLAVYDGFETAGSNSTVYNLTARNNIIEVNRYDVEDYSTANVMSFDYNSMYSTKANPIKWLNNQLTWSAWTTTYGEEAHGIWGSALFTDATNDDFHLQSNSPAIDKGIVLTGFNDADSPWPFNGLAPDLGAFEYGSPAQIEINDISDFQIFPNPSSGIFYIRLNRALIKEASLTLINTMGEILLEKKLSVNEIQQMDISYLTAGIYFIKLTTDNSCYLRKVVIILLTG